MNGILQEIRVERLRRDRDRWRDLACAACMAVAVLVALLVIQWRFGL